MIWATIESNPIKKEESANRRKLGAKNAALRDSEESAATRMINLRRSTTSPMGANWLNIIHIGDHDPAS
ncbi:hypothetical protein HMPREF9496_01754 [Enterococcus faecalis TX4000]|nr:hypothetical protein HMPREF9496_01754 [Enterococcus faecalis TX4000]